MAIDQKPSNPEIKVDPSVIAAEEKAEKTSNSKGEKLFDWLTYGGIAGVGVFILTIPTTYWAKYGGGAKGFLRTSKTLQNAGLSARATEDFLMTTATMQGGNIAVLPVKLMENYKPQLVEKFNNMLGDKSADASIEEDPKQTWGSLIKSRILAWTTVFVSFRSASMAFGGEKFTQFENKFAENIVCKPLGMATHTPGLAKTVANETKMFRYGKIAALDLFATTAASILLYVGSRFFARKNEHWHAQHTHINPPATTTSEGGEAVAAEAPAPEKQKRFTDSIGPQNMSIVKQSETFADAITQQQKTKVETSPGLNT